MTCTTVPAGVAGSSTSYIASCRCGSSRSPSGAMVLMPCRSKTDCNSFRVISTPRRSEEHTSELQSLMRISYAVFCLKKKKTKTTYLKAEKLNTINDDTALMHHTKTMYNKTKLDK